MHPELFSMGPVTVHNYGLLIALGLLAALFLMHRRAAQDGFPPRDKVFDLVFVVVLGGFLGARLFYVLQEWTGYQNHPLEIFQIWKGGLVYYGGVVAAYLVFFFYVRFVGLPFLAASDFLIPYIPLVHAFGRVGCFLNGCCYGKPCDLPWAVQFPFLPNAVHPTQIYEALMNFALFGLLVWFYPRRHFRGEVTSFYLILYSLGRFGIEFFRGDQPVAAFSLTLHQILSFLLMGFGIFLYGICRRFR